MDGRSGYTAASVARSPVAGYWFGPGAPPNPALSADDFTSICRTVSELSGISYHDGKQELIRARLSKRLRLLRLPSYSEYLRYVAADRSGGELARMIEALTTNKTFFWREPAHFEYLQRLVIPRMTNRRMRIWCAGCASGEEPYTTAIVAHAAGIDQARWDAKILATDISVKMVERTRSGIYSRESVSPLPPAYAARYFRRLRLGADCGYQIDQEIKALVHPARLNLLDEWPMSGQFDVIFCRNVMIYFSKQVRQRLVGRFWSMLRPGGHLFIGHSESLTGLTDQYVYIQPAVYAKP